MNPVPRSTRRVVPAANNLQPKLRPGVDPAPERWLHAIGLPASPCREWTRRMDTRTSQR